MPEAITKPNESAEMIQQSSSSTQEDKLVLDPQTIRDLEIFSSDHGGLSFLKFCDLSRSAGGNKVLKRRLESPWSTADSIIATQQALKFIIQHSGSFKRLPAGYAAFSVEKYQREILPHVTSTKLTGFAFGSLTIWSTENSHYFKISQGVARTCKLLEKLHQFVEQPAMAQVEGELVPILSELKKLLTHPLLPKDGREIENFFFFKVWKVFRLDNIFRFRVPDVISRLLEIVYEIDALVSMAEFTRNQGYIFPQVDAGPLHIYAEGLVHPFLVDAVANNLRLDDRRRGLFLTGPNMAGKTTYLRAVTMSLYMAHLGMGVPAKHYAFVPIERLFSSISISDNLHQGVSYFRAEALRVKEIAQAVVAGFKVLATMDEPFKGTNVQDSFEASSAIIDNFSSRDNCLFMFSSHQIELGEKLGDMGYPLDRRCFTAVENEARLRFDFTLREGVSSQRIGMRVLNEEGVFDLFNGKRSCA